MRAGDRFDRYVIEALLGRGGMGEVYRAYDERLRRRVALKLLHSDGATNPDAVLREARAAAALRHPNAVALYDVAESGGRPYLTMEFLEGRSLRTLVGAEGVPLGARLAWLRQAAAVLGEAHRLGLVHRDVKPDNMFVCDDGTLKLLDFGIAKLARAENPPSARRPAASADGVLSEIIGTPLYMAPEHRLGIRADARSDQYAWGVVAFEVISGHHPREFGDERGGRWPQTLAAQAIGPALADVVLRAFRGAPEARFASMPELLASWDVALRAESSPGRPPPPSPHASFAPSPHGPPARATPGAQAPFAGTPPGTPAPFAGALGPPGALGSPASPGQRPKAWGRKLGRSASDAELGILLAGLVVALGLGGVFVALEISRRSKATAAPFVGGAPSAGGSASAAPAPPKARACSPEGDEHAIAEGVMGGTVTSLLAHGADVYAYADVRSRPGGPPEPRAMRLRDGAWQPLDPNRPAGLDPTTLRGAVTTLWGEPALFFHNELVLNVAGIEGTLQGGVRPNSLTRVAFAPRAFALAERGQTALVVALGDREVEGKRAYAGKVVLTRGKCPSAVALDLEAPDPLLVTEAGSKKSYPLAPMVALDERRAAIAVQRHTGVAPVTYLELGEACGDVRVVEGPSLRLFTSASFAFYRGELHWAKSNLNNTIGLEGLEGPAVLLPGDTALQGLAIDSLGDAIATAWVDESADPQTLRFAAPAPGAPAPAPVTLAVGRGMHDVRVRATPAGAFVTWVRGGSLRGRALRCAPPAR